MLKKDKIPFGLLLGFFAPLFGLLLFYFLKFYPYPFKDLFIVLKEQPSLITSIASLTLFVNAILLTLFLNKRKDKTAIGIFIATLVYGIAALIFKFVV